MRGVILSFVVGILVGALAVHFLSAGSERENRPSSEAAASEDSPKAQGAVAWAEPRSEATATASARQPDVREPDDLIRAQLRRYAADGIERGWKAVRKDEIPAEDLEEGMTGYEKLVLQSPIEIGRSLGERRTQAEAAIEDAKSGGVFALLAKLDEGGVGPVQDLVRDSEPFAPLFQRVAREQYRSGLTNRQHPDEMVEDGVTLTWPAGVFRLSELMKTKDPFPRDVTIAGAGMDTTMFVLGGGLMTNANLRNFAIQDCTVHTDGNYLFDLRESPAAMRFDRVRFVGFDMGAGASCLLGTRALALSARQCRFEGGYGRNPGSGTLFDVRTDALVARFESCTVSLLNLHLYRIHPGATVLFLGCTFDRILDDPSTQASEKPGVVFDGCSITRYEGGPETVPHLDLDARFPDWKARME